MNTPPLSESPPNKTPAAPLLFISLVSLAVIARMGLMVTRYSVNVFSWDQWDFLDSFFRHDPSIGELFFWQHGPHREGVGLLADKFLYPLTSWDARVDSFLILFCLIGAMLLALFLKKRLFGQLDYWDAIIPALFLTLTQWEELTLTPNPAYGGFPMLLLMLYLVALLLPNDWIKYGAVLAINYLLIYTGFGIFMGVVTIGVFALICIRRVRGFTATPLTIAIGRLALAAASLASFFYRYKFESAVDCFVFPFHPLSAYPEFVALLFANYLGLYGAAWHGLLLGTPLAALCLYALGAKLHNAAQRSLSTEVSLVIAILLSYSLLFAINTAVGRVCIGIPTGAQSPRYATLLIPAFLGIYLYLRTIERSYAALALLAVALVPGHIRTPPGVGAFAAEKRAWANCYRQREDIAGCTAQAHFPIYPNPEKTRLKEKLDYLKLLQLNLFAE